MEKKKRVTKKEVGWAEKAPNPCCSRCVHLKREGTYGEKFLCGKARLPHEGHGHLRRLPG